MKVTSFISHAFAAVAFAVPSGKGSSSQGTAQLATFDDLTAVPALSQINPVGTYKGLKYRSLNVLQVGVLGAAQVAGLKPQSGSQVAANSITGTVLTGAPSISVASPYKSFDLQSLYFGCAVNSAASAVGVPQQCTIAFVSLKSTVLSISIILLTVVLLSLHRQPTCQAAVLHTKLSTNVGPQRTSHF